MFNSPDIFYLTRPNFQGPWELQDSDLQKIQQHRLAIIDLSSEHWGANGLDTAYEKFDSLGINFLLLSHEPSDHQKFARMLYFPHWYFFSVKNFRLPKSTSATKTHSWSCLNRNPRAHRIHNYILSRSKPYFAQAKFSMFNLPEDSCMRVDDVVLEPSIVDEWNIVKHSLPDRHFAKGQWLDLTIPELVDTYIHLVTESTVLPRVFITEKTWKPIATQQLFLIFGNPGSINALRQLGVDVFDDIVDHSYDLEASWSNRIEMIHNSIESLLKQDLQSIYQLTADRRARNQELFANKLFGKQYKQDLENAISQYL